MTARTAREMRQRLTRFHHATEPENDNAANIGVPEWAVLFEVPIATTRYKGYDTGITQRYSKQRIDAVAVGIWATRTAHEIRGYEIKVSRSDLLAELRDPGKAAVGIEQCDSWWLALGDPALLKDSDVLPPGWGVVACAGSGLRVVHPAEQRQGQHSGQFIAGLIQAQLRSPSWRRASGYRAGFQAGFNNGKQHARVRYLDRATGLDVSA